MYYSVWQRFIQGGQHPLHAFLDGDQKSGIGWGSIVTNLLAHCKGPLNVSANDSLLDALQWEASWEGVERPSEAEIEGKA